MKQARVHRVVDVMRDNLLQWKSPIQQNGLLKSADAAPLVKHKFKGGAPITVKA